MKADRLLAQYERIADAPDAVARLRRFILDLAVRGKLVPQDPNDEPALAALAGAKAWLGTRVKEVKRVRWEASKPIDPAEVDKEVPSGWISARVNDTGLYINGMAFKPSDWKKSGTPIIRIQNLTDIFKEFNFAEGEFPDEVIVRDGDILVSWSATLDAFKWTRGTGVLNQHIFRVIPAPRITDGAYLLLLLRKAIREMADSEHAHGLAMMHINRGPFMAHVVLIPPLPEQKRIVAKVDELMALCDQLDKARAEREATRDRLAAASLARLNEPDPETFHDDARFVLNALPAITARPDQVKQLRQTILNLAVRGKLVPQDANDEPAAELLKGIAMEIAAYSRVNRIGQTAAEPIPDDDLPFAVPNGWQWTRLCALFNVITDGDHQPPPKADKGVAFLTIGNVTTGQLNFTGCRLVPEAYFKSLAPYRTPAKGDILYTVVGATYGRPALVETDRAFCVQRHIAILKPVEAMNVRFLMALLASPLIYDQATNSTTGTAQPTIALRPLRSFLAPLPPLAEQHRIVAKVDELISLCDRLEADLTKSGKVRSRLLGALLHEALGPASSELGFEG